MWPDPESDDAVPTEPEEVVEDRVEHHADEQRRRAHEEPQHSGAPDRTVGTEASPQAEAEQRAANADGA